MHMGNENEPYERDTVQLLYYRRLLTHYYIVRILTRFLSLYEGTVAD